MVTKRETTYLHDGAVQQILDHEAQIQELAEEYGEGEWFFFIGRAAGYPVALESALKLKEISYDHAEGFPAGKLKHGPLALVTPDTVGIAILTEAADPETTTHNVQEAKTRGADIIGLASDAEYADHVDALIDIPAIGTMEPVVANVALQLFAYYVAKLKGRDIDKPRNLAKSVTVE